VTGPETGAGPGAGEARGAGARGVDAPGTGGAPGHGGPGGGPVREPVTPAELAVVAAQLGRRPRGTRAVAHRCPCGLPDVVETSPRLPDGTPFPTLYYLTCRRAVSACGRLEATGTMREMNRRLAEDPDLAARYRAAHHDYLARREAIEVVPEIAGVSAGGMPGRVKCLHALLAHSLAVGPGVNPIGDETRELVGEWWADGPCVSPPDEADAAASA
jgi:hypothetical protein